LPWEQLFFEADCKTPLRRQDVGKLTHVFEMVRLSPSASNKQPWRLVLDGNSVHFFLKRSKGYRKSMFSDLQRIDMGIAMCHFEAACKELNISATWKIQNPLDDTCEHWEYLSTWVGHEQ